MAKAKPKTNGTGWANRIIKSGSLPADQFLAHDLNARRHPGAQRDALRGSLDSVGWIAPVIVSSRSGKMLDGHARVEEALSKDDKQLIPYVEVDVSEDEEHLILATFDPITDLAGYDRDTLGQLLALTETSNDALNSLMHDLAASIGLIEGQSVDDVWQGMPEFESQDGVFRSIIVHFETQDDVDSFSKLLNQTFTDKTKFVWYPYKPNIKYTDYVVAE